ncbi:MAG: hypothetical protein AAF376_17345 [Pseudomonadota bacterium]
MIKGDHVFSRDGAFDGMIGGTATIKAGAVVKLSGMVGGDLVVERGATVHLTGMVGGRILNDGQVIRG